MKKFRILVADHLCKNKQWKKAGDIVDENQLCSPANELVAKNYIEPIEESKEEPIEESKPKPKAKSKTAKK